MSEQLWSDERISQAIHDSDAGYVPLETKRVLRLLMRQMRDDYEAALAKANAEIERLQQRVQELEAKGATNE